MKKNLLRGLLDDLLPAEWADLANWLASPAHNSRPELGRLLRELACDNETGVERDPAAHLAAAEPDRPWDEQRYRHLTSYLLRQAEEWLAYRHWRTTRGPDECLPAAYRERGLNDLLDNRLLRRRNRRERERADLMYSEDERHYDWALATETYRRTAAGARRRDRELHPAEREMALHRYLLRTKLMQAARTLAYQRLRPDAFDIPLLEEHLTAAESLPDEPDIYLAAAACRLYRGASNERDAHFHALRDGLAANLGRLPHEDARDLLTFAINHCILRINEGQDAAYLEELFGLYQRGTDLGLLLDRGRISPFTFNNVTGVAVRLDKLAWAARFVADHRDRLPPDRREEVYALNAGRLAYAGREYDDALALLQSADYQDFIHHMTARLLQLKIYYERGQDQLLAAHLKNTRALLRRRRGKLGYHLDNYRNVLRLTDRLSRLPPYGGAARTKLRQDVERTQPLTERRWLLERIDRRGAGDFT